MDNNDNRRMIRDAGGLKVTKINSKQSKCMSPRFFFFYMRRVEISNGCMNGRYREGNSRSHWIVRWCGGSKCATKRGHRELYSKERYIGGLANRLWKVTLVPVTTWHMPYAQYDGIYDLPKESHYLSYFLIESHMKELLLHIAQFVSIHLNSSLIERLETRRSSILHGTCKSYRSVRDEVFLAASLVNNARKFACNPLPVTGHPSPTTRHPSPTTHHPLPATRYPPPATRYPLPATRHPLPVTRHPPPATRHLPPATHYPPPVEKCCQAVPNKVCDKIYTFISVFLYVHLTQFWVVQSIILPSIRQRIRIWKNYSALFQFQLTQAFIINYGLVFLYAFNNFQT